MDLRTAITLALGATITPGYPTRAGSFRLGLSSRQFGLPDADEIYAGILKFTASDARDIDIQAGDLTLPISPTADDADGFTGRNADGELISLDLLYAIGVRAPAANAHVISITNVGIWTDGPLGTGGATEAGKGLHIHPGGEIILVNPAGWEMAGSGAEKLKFTADATVGASTLEVVVIGIDTAPASS